MTNYTSRAWTDSHVDYFTRNIITVDGGDEASAAEARARNEFSSNAVGLTWPTEDEVMQWRDGNNYGPDTQAPAAMILATQAAVSRIAERCGLLVRPVDVNGDVNPNGDAVEVPAEVVLATTMLASRLYDRRTSPTGILGSDSTGGAVRTGRFDADIEMLIANHIVYGLA